MTTYYVRKTGSDGAAGTSAGAAWATIGKALGASGIASGDTVYIGAGTYRETVPVNMASAVAETLVIGDVDGSHTGDVGEVQLTAYTTNDKTAPSSTALVNLAAKDFLTFRNIVFIGGSNVNASCVDGRSATSTNITFTDCFFVGHYAGNCIGITIGFGVAAHWLFDRCGFIKNGSGSSLQITLTTGVGSDYDADIVVRNSQFVAGGSVPFVNVVSSGTSAQEGGGVDVLNCTVIGCGSLLATVGSTRVGGATFTVPMTAYNNVALFGDAIGLDAGELGAIVENYNYLFGPTARINVTAGAQSISNGSYAPLFHFGQEVMFGGAIRPFGMPSAGSPWLGFGGNSPPSVDKLNAPRPSGGVSASTAIGAYERSNTFAKETGTVRTGANAISITGPGYQDFQLPVAASSTTVTVYVRWDATYAGTKPKMQVLNGTEAGVADATATATGSSGAWEQLSLNFTPARAGIVTVRLLSSDTNGGGKMFADDFTVA